MDNEGYPEDAVIKAITEYVPDDRTGWTDLVNLIKAAWNEPMGSLRQEGSRLILVTGGWSGNEEVIGALQSNRLFWACCWDLSKRGGYFEFDLGR